MCNLSIICFNLCSTPSQKTSRSGFVLSQTFKTLTEFIEKSVKFITQIYYFRKIYIKANLMVLISYHKYL